MKIDVSYCEVLRRVVVCDAYCIVAAAYKIQVVK